MKTPIVLVPGIDGTGRMYHRQVPLLQRAYDVSVVRLRDDARRMQELVDDLDATISKAAPDGRPVTLVGESFGGALVMSYALARRARVARLVVLNSFARVSTVWCLQSSRLASCSRSRRARPCVCSRATAIAACSRPASICRRFSTSGRTIR